MSNEKRILNEAVKNRIVAETLDFIKDDHYHSIEEQIDLVCIEAPTGEEDERAAEMCKKFRELGLSDVHVDEKKNAIGILKGYDSQRTLLVEAHLDTVFPKGSVKERPVMDENEEIHCPGITDNTRGLAIILSVLRGIKNSGIKFKNDIIFAGTSLEEGMGSLGGMKYIYDTHPEISANISVDGGGCTEVVYNATGYITKRFTLKGKNGHSYVAFGRIAQVPHAVSRAISKIAEFDVPQKDPRCSFAVTSINGGNLNGLHMIPEEMSFVVNYRSEDAYWLKKLDEDIENCVKEACEEENKKWNTPGEITYSIETFCDVPAGNQTADLPLVRAFQEVIRYFGNEPKMATGGSSNANVSIGRGIESIAMGGGMKEHQHVHSSNERFQTKGAYLACQTLYLLVLLCGGSDFSPSIFE